MQWRNKERGCIRIVQRPSMKRKNKPERDRDESVWCVKEGKR